jgi:Plasmid encoded RepA protein
LIRESLDKLITESLAIEAQEAKAAGALGYMARALTQATMPHAPSEATEFVRRNGAFTLTMFARRDVGLPYGSVPRLLMAWLTTEAVRTKEPVLTLGPTLSSFMAELDLVPTGGRWGTITRLRGQTRRLFSCAIAANYSDGSKDFGQNFFVADKYELWWSPKEPHQSALWQSNVTLNPTFFREVTTYPVPIDLRALKALKRSPLALDIYCWLTYRLSYLKGPKVIPWGALQLQFGSGYPQDGQGLRNFKKAFLRELKKVRLVYQAAKVGSSDRGLELRPSRTHIPLLAKPSHS